MSLPRSFMPSMRSMQHLVLLVLLISPEQVLASATDAAEVVANVLEKQKVLNETWFPIVVLCIKVVAFATLIFNVRKWSARHDSSDPDPDVEGRYGRWWYFRAQWETAAAEHIDEVLTENAQLKGLFSQNSSADTKARILGEFKQAVRFSDLARIYGSPDGAKGAFMSWPAYLRQNGEKFLAAGQAGGKYSNKMTVDDVQRRVYILMDLYEPQRLDNPMFCTCAGPKQHDEERSAFQSKDRANLQTQLEGGEKGIVFLSLIAFWAVETGCGMTSETSEATITVKAVIHALTALVEMYGAMGDSNARDLGFESVALLDILWNTSVKVASFGFSVADVAAGIRNAMVLTFKAAFALEIIAIIIWGILFIDVLRSLTRLFVRVFGKDQTFTASASSTWDVPQDPAQFKETLLEELKNYSYYKSASLEQIVQRLQTDDEYNQKDKALPIKPFPRLADSAHMDASSDECMIAYMQASGFVLEDPPMPMLTGKSFIELCADDTQESFGRKIHVQSRKDLEVPPHAKWNKVTSSSITAACSNFASMFRFSKSSSPAPGGQRDVELNDAAGRAPAVNVKPTDRALVSSFAYSQNQRGPPQTQQLGSSRAASPGSANPPRPYGMPGPTYLPGNGLAHPPFPPAPPHGLYGPGPGYGGPGGPQGPPFGLYGPAAPFGGAPPPGWR